MFHLARSTRGALAASLPVFALATTPLLAQFTTYSNGAELGIDDGAITPDGRYAVIRTGSATALTIVIDLATGLEVAEFQANYLGGNAPGPCNDAIELNNTRAVSLGATTKVIDLTATPPVELADINMGERPRDVALTEDGRFAIVQGGGLGPSGTYVLDLQSGAQLLFRPTDSPQIFELGNDLAAASNDHGITLGFDSAREETILTVVEFDPLAGGGPRIVFGQSLADQLEGRPMDVAISPDGRLAAVRAENEIAMLRLDGPNTAFLKRFSAFPGQTLPYLDTTFDSIVMTNDVYASITIGDSASADGFLNIANEAGTEWFALLDGTPRDLTVTPDGETLLVHTGQRLYEFQLGSLPAGGGPLSTVNFRPLRQRPRACRPVSTR